MIAILSDTVPHPAEKALCDLGYRTLRLPPHPMLPPPVNSHPDMLLFFSSDAIFCTEDYAKIAQKELMEIARYTAIPIRTVSQAVGNTYPHDVLLNAAPIGRFLICRPDATAKELTEHPDFTVLPVRQGYAKCSVIPLGKDALITDDASIASAARRAGLDVLLLPHGDIRLDGYPYGFVGGCASFAPFKKGNTVFWCGSLRTYAHGDAMQAFCKAHHTKLISLGDFPTIDVGTVFLIER